MAKKIFKPGDELTIEDVRESIRQINEDSKRYSVNESSGIKREVIGGCAVFDSYEDMEKYYGKLYTIDEVFKW